MNKLVILTIVAVAFAALCDANGSRRRNGRRNGGIDESQALFGGRGGQNVNRVLGARGRGGAGSDTAAEVGAFSGSSLKAGEKSADAFDGLLQKKDAHQAKLDKKAARKQRRAERKRARDAAALKAVKAVDLEEYVQDQSFHRLDAAANLDKENNFALQIASSNKHKEQAAIKKESGSKAAAGTKFNFLEEIDAKTSQEADAAFEDNFLDENFINAAEASEGILNAKESAKQQQEAVIDAKDVEQFNTNLRNNDFFEDDIFGGRFGSFFKRK